MKNDSNTCPRLIEVALPIREISAESVRDKSLRHGHISTLHLWWARRPLPASRAIVFASLVPDPDDPRCPEEFRQTVQRFLKNEVPSKLRHYSRGRNRVKDEDPYRPYDGIPDTLRNRLLMFIAKWSPEALAFNAGKTANKPKPKELLDDRSLVKWETSSPENPQGHEILQIARELVKIANGGEIPTVLDPFAGGGAIPLEAGRLGCKAIANDYNPVAYLILRATCEFPQKYGRIDGLKEQEIERLRRELTQDEPEQEGTLTSRLPRRTLDESFNPLAYDVEKWAKWILERAREKIGHLYPVGSDGRPVVGYIWARTAPCSNPSCRGEIPLLRSLLVCNKKDKKVALTMDVDKEQKTVRFRIAKDGTIERTEGTKRANGPAICPFCGQPTSAEELRRAGQEERMGERMVAVIVEGRNAKDYRPVEEVDLAAFREAASMDVQQLNELIRPEVTASLEHVSNRGDITVYLYGMKTWGSLFNSRQLVAMQTFVETLHEALDKMKDEVTDADYRKAVGVYLGLWVSRNSMRMSTVGAWHITGEKLEKPFEGARLSMKWDYPEANPFSRVTGGFINQLKWIIKYIAHEGSTASTRGIVLRSDGAHLPAGDASADATVTDPPYFDEVAYADLSDFFYVWIKRGIGNVIPEAMATPLTPKTEEATALKHRFEGGADSANRHFTRKLTEIFTEAKRVTKPNRLFSVIFAHQSTEAWVALIDSLFAAKLTIDATWPIEMEMANRPRAQNSAALQTSIVVACRPRIAGSAASFKEVRVEIERVVQEAVKRFWSYGFRGADLIVACYGPAVGVFGKYERVEKADGTLVAIPELLELAKRAARDAIAGEFRGDSLSTLYYVWANLYGVSDQAWDDARMVVQIGGQSENAMEVARQREIFVVDGSKCRLAMLADRASLHRLGVDGDSPLIDSLHRAMLLWKEEKRRDLISYLTEHDLLQDGPFWKLAQALFDVLPHNVEDWKLVSTLLSERPTLIAESRVAEGQRELFDNGG